MDTTTGCLWRDMGVRRLWRPLGPDLGWLFVGPESRTVQVALPTLRTGQVVDYGLLAAGIVMTLLPVYLVYAFMQRRMREALVTGAVKG